LGPQAIRFLFVSVPIFNAIGKTKEIMGELMHFSSTSTEYKLDDIYKLPLKTGDPDQVSWTFKVGDYDYPLSIMGI
jgi:hypothetical protein